MICPYCLKENVDEVLVCVTCSRDIAVPATLIAERDDLIAKRDAAREELQRAMAELAMFKTRENKRSA
ncbi:hypothetical protein [Bradyrhizobium sp. SYSU BS000235]|uniref:hypothetical protein n=1 Tax=Bradyrhizobium sp. SYSU BS000235 TaxID=3411332 RepID=UPI003C730862